MKTLLLAGALAAMTVGTAQAADLMPYALEWKRLGRELSEAREPVSGCRLLLYRIDGQNGEPARSMVVDPTSCTPGSRVQQQTPSAGQ
jgi:hypothetical protein